MPTYRARLPQLDGELLLSDSGIETDLIFNKGIDLPGFAAFPLLADDAGREVLAGYYREHLAVAARHGTGFLFETVTWRSNPDWGASLGYSQADLDELDRAAVELVLDLREASVDVSGSMPVSGLLGPRDDGYQVDTTMTADAAQRYHAHQVENFASTEVDLVSVHTLAYAAEGIGVALAARDAELPVCISFTVETDGRLPDGTSLAGAVTTVDAATDGYVAGYGVNCAHPEHLGAALRGGGAWTRRLVLFRANASRRSHAELDEADGLDSGDPAELAAAYAALRRDLPHLTVLGGCCGTDARHLAAIADAVVPV